MKKIEDIINKIICGDTLTELRKISDESIDMCITQFFLGVSSGIFTDFKKDVFLSSFFGNPNFQPSPTSKFIKNTLKLKILKDR